MKTARLLFAGLALFAFASLLDAWAFHHFQMVDVYATDWGRFLRIQGFLPTWIVAATALALQDRTPGRRLHRSRAGLLFFGAAFGGIAAELLKLVLRRQRPGELGLYVFRPFSDRPLFNGGLALPSSHALVAFTAAAILARLFPRSRYVWWALAWGCALTRVAAHAHFFSDVMASFVISWAVGAWVWRWRDPTLVPEARPARRRLRPVGEPLRGQRLSHEEDEPTPEEEAVLVAELFTPQ